MASTGSSKQDLQKAVFLAAAYFKISSMKAQTKRDKPPVKPMGNETIYSRIMAKGTAIIPAMNVDIKADRGSGWLSSLSQNQSHSNDGTNPPAMAKNKFDAVRFSAIFQ